MTGLVVGIDAGATTTRCALADGSGTVLASGSAPGANLNSSADAAAALHEAIAAALSATSRVDALVLGVAGAGPAGQPRAEQVMREVLDRAGVRVGRLVVHSDVEVAFAAGSAGPDGTVLIAGTGAVAARIEAFAVVERIDGHGFLLGDRGSAVWIGTAALRAVLADIERTGGRTALRAAVAEPVRSAATNAQLDEAQAVVAAAYSRHPAWLGTLAPLVERCAEQGDARAIIIVDEAVAALVATTRAAAAGSQLPLVVTGGVAAGNGLLGRRVREQLEAALGVVPTVVDDGLRGAVALAVRALALPPDAPSAPSGMTA